MKRDAEAGMTLVEVLVALTILGLAVAGITQSLGGASIASAAHRRTVSADTVVRDYAEAVKDWVVNGGYANCAASGAYNDTAIGFATPAGFKVSQTQTTYQNLSGSLNVVLVLDKSSSIAKEGAVDSVKAAGTAFLNGLKDTGARVAVVSFGTTASTPVGPLPDTSGANFTTLQNAVNASFGGWPPPLYWTNWDDGLLKAQNTFASFPAGSKPLVVMVTDGDPNYWVNDSGSPLTGNDTTAVNEAVAQANAIKALGSKVFAVGVGSLNIPNLKAISGPDEFPTVPFGDAEWTKVAAFSDLQSTLASIAATLAQEDFTTSCPNPDAGAQALRLSASSVDGLNTETLDIVVRRP